MTALRTVLLRYGLPMALYTDRVGWAFYTPKAGGRVDPEQLTQVGRALRRLGIEHIPAYSPRPAAGANGSIARFRIGSSRSSGSTGS